jgi:hypothetical protein
MLIKEQNVQECDATEAELEFLCWVKNNNYKSGVSISFL